MCSQTYGYVRVSTRDQNDERQMIAMHQFGIYDEMIFRDKQSGKDFIRPQYQKLLRKLRNIIKFGRYEQDNNKSNGTEEIEWTVLAAEDDKVLLINKYALDAKPYNKAWVGITWEKCTLRKWLNNDFFNSAFTADEQSGILLSDVKAEKNPNYSTDPGKDTQDKIFLLSVNEANKYFANKTARQCQATEYTVAKNAYVASNGNIWWWLRSPGYDSISAAGVDKAGGFDYSEVDYISLVVRPALWLSLDSLIP